MLLINQMMFVTGLSLRRGICMLAVVLCVAGGCSSAPRQAAGDRVPEILTIYPDGSMELMGRPVPEEDVVIYPDGYGGEKAAVLVRIEPFHSNFYRDTIIVRRVTGSDGN